MSVQRRQHPAYHQDQYCDCHSMASSDSIQDINFSSRNRPGWNLIRTRYYGVIITRKIRPLLEAAVLNQIRALQLLGATGRFNHRLHRRIPGATRAGSARTVALIGIPTNSRVSADRPGIGSLVGVNRLARSR